MTCIWASKVQSNPVVGVGPVPETRHHSGRSIKLVAVSNRSQYVWITSRQRAVLAHHVTGRAALSAQSRSTKTRAIGTNWGSLGLIFGWILWLVQAQMRMRQRRFSLVRLSGGRALVIFAFRLGLSYRATCTSKYHTKHALH